MTRSPRIALAIAAMVMATPAGAETIRITAASAAPPVATNVKAIKDYIIPEIDRRIAASGKDFKIEWNEAWSSTLAKFSEIFEAVEEGIADFALVINIFEPSKLPLDQYGRMMPFGPRDARLTIRIDRAIRDAVPAMNQAYVEHNQRMLGAGGNMDTGLFTTFPVRTIEDLKGRKFGASGTMGAYFQGTGGVYVSSAMVNAYADIKNGLYDGYPIALAFAFPFKLHEAAPYFTNVGFGTAANSVLSINLVTWKKLPGWVQQIFTDVGAEYVEAYARIDEARFKKFIGIMKKQGVRFYDLPQAERRRWANAMPNIALDWVKKNEARGHPARAVLATYMQQLRKHDLPVLRDWEKE